MSARTDSTLRISADALRAFRLAAFEKVGVSRADAETAADVLVTTDSWGVFTHGVKPLRHYIHRLRGGGLRAQGRPAITIERIAIRPALA
jgi:ureidoglycolate dehydrogenase (NAD+)